MSHIEYNDFTNNTNVTHVASSIQIQESIDRFYKHFGRTLLDVDEDNYIESKSVHQSLVCVVCDCFIIGRNEYHWISKESLLFHKDTLSYRYYYKNGINPILKSQYDVGDMTLSEYHLGQGRSLM